MKPLHTITLAHLLGAMSMAVQAGPDIDRGKQIATEKCQACHGIEGNATNPQFPRLAGQHRDYMVHALKQYKNGERTNAIMAGQAAGLSMQDIQDVSAWYASQEGLIQINNPRIIQR